MRAGPQRGRRPYIYHLTLFVEDRIMTTNPFEAAREIRAKAQKNDEYTVIEVKHITMAAAPQGSPENKLSVVFNERYDLTVSLPASETILLTEIGCAFSALALHQHVEAILWKIDEYTCKLQYLIITPKKE
jgi:hypothetical protein